MNNLIKDIIKQSGKEFVFTKEEENLYRIRNQ